MRLHRFITALDLSQSNGIISDPDLLHQWTKVLRLHTGDTVVLCDGKGMEVKGTLRSLDRKHATVQLESQHPVGAEPDRSVTLYCAVLKRENFEWVVQKCTELGIKAIIPIVTTRTVKTGLKMERLRMIAREAAEQSGRGIVPVISEPMEFDRALEEGKNTRNLFFHTLTNQQTSKPANEQTPLGIWVGPEGGWTEEEVMKAKDAGFAIASLGALTLRAETAAIIGCFTVLQR
ncbi:hypothetical protein A2881_02460 [Candidatus Peribacteria bacterium RIFCSPHIGHO2_01_FULL_55_13]|nr:MAG: hypothetical protein A2881_02460 [Candidatus Peribacteria bacterium RIFCSPHIGHO2_01_FULL_55_13]OGJ64615.1 MAG: hypothetical protein A3F36_01480 [Candidatus Peribacteria bacterium RIFCSPHIGHO2_12_FULL_55_11]